MVRGRLVLCDAPGWRPDGRGGDLCPRHAAEAARPPAGPEADRGDPAAERAAGAIVRAIADHQ